MTIAATARQRNRTETTIANRLVQNAVVIASKRAPKTGPTAKALAQNAELIALKTERSDGATSKRPHLNDAHRSATEKPVAIRIAATGVMPIAASNSVIVRQTPTEPIVMDAAMAPAKNDVLTVVPTAELTARLNGAQIVKIAGRLIVMAAGQNAGVIVINVAAPIVVDIATDAIAIAKAIIAITVAGIASVGARTTGTIGTIIAGQTVKSIA